MWAGRSVRIRLANPFVRIHQPSRDICTTSLCVYDLPIRLSVSTGHQEISVPHLCAHRPIRLSVSTSHQEISVPHQSPFICLNEQWGNGTGVLLGCFQRPAVSCVEGGTPVNSDPPVGFVSCGSSLSIVVPPISVLFQTMATAPSQRVQTLARVTNNLRAIGAHCDVWRSLCHALPPRAG
jgi:hypothetical protein